MRIHWPLVLLACLQCAEVAVGDDWPQWRGPTRDDVWHETGLVEKFRSPQLPIQWKAEVSSGYSGPTVSGGRVFVTDRTMEPAQNERVLCFDQHSGKKLWQHEYPCQYKIGYPAGPRASVSIDSGRAYSLGAMGHLFCLSAESGAVLWQKDLATEYKIAMPIWGIAASPLVDGDLLIVQVGGEAACLVAFEKATGKERWRALDDQASYAAPVLVEQAGRRVLVCLTGDHVVGLDPANGKLFWEYPFPPTKMVISIATPVISDNWLFVTSFYDGSLMLRLHQDKLAVEKVWKRQGADEKHTDGLHSIISTPMILDDYVYGVDSYGELRCLKADDGERVWESLDATPKVRWGTIHMVRNGNRVWMLNERGDLIICHLSPKGYQEISRSHLLEPTEDQLRQRGGVVWSHPAYADKHIFARNDRELVCASLASE